MEYLFSKDNIQMLIFVVGVYLFSFICKVIYRRYQIKKYKETNYYKESNIDFDSLVNNTGTKGEYYIYNVLEKVPGHKKIIVNCYLPKDDGTTTEVDLILIHGTGIYVIESKNYSGWIFGDEKYKNWTQCLPVGKGKTKNSKFFNPIAQNRVHIKWLKVLLKDRENLNYYSYIVFGDDATFKKLTIYSKDVRIIYRSQLLSKINNIIKNISPILSDKEIDDIYLILKQYSNVNEQIMNEHIENIKNKYYSHNNDIDKKEVISKEQ